jgi:hypothetical protein
LARLFDSLGVFFLCSTCVIVDFSLGFERYGPWLSHSPQSPFPPSTGPAKSASLQFRGSQCPVIGSFTPSVIAFALYALALDKAQIIASPDVLIGEWDRGSKGRDADDFLYFQGRFLKTVNCAMEYRTWLASL